MLNKLFLILVLISFVWGNTLPTVSSIEFKGHKITKDYIIQREIQHPLDIPLDSSLADQDKDRLLNLGIFADVSWNMVPLEDLTVILQYNLVESSLRILPAASPTYEEEYGWSFGGMLMIRNFREKNENLTLAGSTGARESYFLSFNNPWIMGDHVSLRFMTGRSNTIHPFLNYEQNTLTSEIIMGRYFGYKHKASIGFELERKTFTSSIDTLVYFSINPLGSYSFDTRDVYRDPSKGLLITQGFFSILDLEKEMNNFWWIQSYSIYHTINKSDKKLTAAFNMSFLTTFGEIDEVFVSWLGGAQNVRGWSIPTNDIYSNTNNKFRFGNHSAVFSAELRQTIIPTQVFKTELMEWKQEYGLSLVGFLDVGYTSREKEDLFSYLPMVGTGFGIRIPFPMVGTFGLDYGWGYRNGSFIDQALHLVVGQKF
ncbi:MAG: POTRA domain-containing protein [Candidatus Marinimicrobia bacterium]|nr:POTRA domain-containing protein [Candidatus Neomarinimicrobiota bacterium]